MSTNKNYLSLSAQMFALYPAMNGNAFLCVLVVTLSIPGFVLTESDAILQNTNISYVCGRSMTLTCKFKINTTAMVWKNENDIAPIAQCIYNVCKLNPVYVGLYTISFDMTQCIFNLTFIKVNMKDNGRKLVCSDGSHTDSKIIRVREFEPRLIEDRILGTIKATSGCISRDKQVSFEWIRISARSNVESTINRNISYKTTSCSTGSECGHYNGIVYTPIIHAKPSDNGNYYLKLTVIYGNERLESRKSVLKYTIDGQDNDNEEMLIICLIIGFCAVFIIVLVIFVACVIIRKHRKCGPLKECSKQITNNHNQAGKENNEEETYHMAQDTLSSTEKIKRQKQKLIAELKELLPTKTQKWKDAIN